MGVELEDPVPHDLKRHAADLRSFRPRGAVVDRSQRQEPPRLPRVPGSPRLAAKGGSIKIGSNRIGIANFMGSATTNQNITDSGIQPKSLGHRELVLYLGIAEYARPFAESEIGSDEDRGALIEAADEMEEQLASGLGEGKIGELVEDDEGAASEMIGDPSLSTGAGRRRADGSSVAPSGASARARPDAEDHPFVRRVMLEFFRLPAPLR